MGVKIYTDGSSLGNPGPSAGAFVVIDDGVEIDSGTQYMHNGTNNHAELMAFIIALEWVENNRPKTEITEIFSDSQYVVKGCNEWLPGWAKKNFNIKNPDFWKHINTTLKRVNVKVSWVRGHANDEWNDRVDRLAKAAAKAGSY